MHLCMVLFVWFGLVSAIQPCRNIQLILGNQNCPGQCLLSQHVDDSVYIEDMFQRHCFTLGSCFLLFQIQMASELSMKYSTSCTCRSGLHSENNILEIRRFGSQSCESWAILLCKKQKVLYLLCFSLLLTTYSSAQHIAYAK